MSHDDTKQMIELLISSPAEVARARLHEALTLKEQSVAKFYNGIIKHAPAMRLTTSQWFEILSRLPNRVLRSQLQLESLLSEEQIKRLPPVTG